jgi:hypothetical protein
MSDCHSSTITSQRRPPHNDRDFWEKTEVKKRGYICVWREETNAIHELDDSGATVRVYAVIIYNYSSPAKSLPENYMQTLQSEKEWRHIRPCTYFYFGEIIIMFIFTLGIGCCCKQRSNPNRSPRISRSNFVLFFFFFFPSSRSATFLWLFE